VRQRVLAVLFGQPDRSFYANEVIALAQSGTGAVQRELADMAQVGLISVTKVGNQKHFQANTQSPVFTELRGLVLKTVGLADVLRRALAPLNNRIDTAFVYGSMANQQDTAQSDVDVMLISPTLSYAEVFGALESASQQIKRDINPTLYTPDEFAQRLDQDQAFITRVMQQPKIWLIGQLEQTDGQHRT
jgi:predicted nucleotidyltransferase